MSIRIALLALQGAFAEHGKMFNSLGAECIELRQRADLDRHFDALVLPGGESTVQGKLLRELEMFEVLHRQIQSGLPVFATCAGLILLAQELEDDPVRHFALLPVKVRRNAYGRQRESFYASGIFSGMENIPMPFIRAPQIIACSKEVDVLAEINGSPTAVSSGNIMAMSFHPEITGDTRIHKFFLEKIKNA